MLLNLSMKLEATHLSKIDFNSYGRGERREMRESMGNGVREMRIGFKKMI